MTGGQAFLWDRSGRVPEQLNPALVEAFRPGAEALAELRSLIARHADLTGSGRAADLLARWHDPHFWQVLPIGQSSRLHSGNASRVGANV